MYAHVQDGSNIVSTIVFLASCIFLEEPSHPLLFFFLNHSKGVAGSINSRHIYWARRRTENPYKDDSPTSAEGSYNHSVCNLFPAGEFRNKGRKKGQNIVKINSSSYYSYSRSLVVLHPPDGLTKKTTDCSPPASCTLMPRVS